MAVVIYATQILGLPQLFSQQETEMYSPIPDLTADPIEPCLVRNRQFDFNPIYRKWLERDERTNKAKFTVDQIHGKYSEYELFID